MREMTIEPREQRRGDVFLEIFGDDAPNVRRMIRVRRDEPLPPPLPLAQGSVVYAQIGETWAEWFLTQQGAWTRIQGFHEYPLSSAELHDRLTRFHVIAEPRALVAHEVLERVRAVHRSAGDQSIPARFQDELAAIGRDFGAEL